MSGPAWSRDNRILAAIGAALGAALTALYALVLRARDLAPGAAANRVLLFVLFYIVVLLIVALLFVLTRSAVKLLMDARRGVFGSRFRVRVVTTHVGLALLPIALLLLPTTGLLQKSVDTWFAPPVAETVESGRAVVELVRRRAANVELRTALRLREALSAASDPAGRLAVLARAREEAGLDLVEWREGEGPPLTVSSARWPVRNVNDPGADWAAEARSRGSVRRIEPVGDGGQIGRTVVALPEGLLVLGTYDPPEEASPLRTLSRATSTYLSLEAERASLGAIQVLLFLLLAFLVLLAAVWVGLLLARRVTRPIAALAASARKVGAGDFDALVEVEGGDEIAALSGAFNTMTSELRASREGLVTANRDLADTNRRLDAILAHITAGVVAFDDSRGLLHANETACRLLGAGGCPSAGERPADAASRAVPTIDQLLAPPHLSALAEAISAAVAGTGPNQLTLSLPRPRAAHVLEVRVARVPPHEGLAGSWVVTLEDTTALVAAERAAAWEEAARRMAHEIKNPLTPIRLAAERMRRRALSGAGDLPAVVEEGASTIVEEVGTLSSLVDAFGRFARMPAAELSETDLAQVVSQVTKLYGSVKPGVAVSAELPSSLPAVRADAEQVKRALINLVDNAVSATPRGGHVTIRAAVEGGQARLLVEDDGPGIAPEDRDRVFDPTFSTKSRGSGLGLAIVSRIAAEHGGAVRVEENQPRGCRFVLSWPSSAATEEPAPRSPGGAGSGAPPANAV